jgi:hypothetical protein
VGVPHQIHQQDINDSNPGSANSDQQQAEDDDAEDV